MANYHAPGTTSATTRYDERGRPISGIDPHGHAWSVTYNDNGQVATYTNPRGMVYDYGYHLRSAITRDDFS
ncbi:RHS repeat protein [Acanthopleuribacter pedis]|uniref:RHS repeat protein n=1 Tax=Acanthopleuribacter pedis TaxID=442870 RepID=A0A8J7U5S9_9BACT|nr:RHS repeat protein [Acanthopleuribacter pedis]MBO1322878.1 RHS repeat protein [Acanthopleuribacter pedis]